MIPKVTQFLGSVGNRVGTVAREARDIPTAVGTVMTKWAFPKDVESGPSNKNLGTQIKEVGTSAFTGKKGTTSDINTRAMRTGFLKGDTDPSYGYEKGSKRK